MSQIGEFSFILAELGRSLELMSQEAESLVLAGALVSITLNPLMMRSVDPVLAQIERRPSLERLARGRHTPIG